MHLTPLVGETPITVSTFSIRIDPEDKLRVTNLAARAEQIILVNNSDTFALARHCAGQLKALLVEIEEAKKASKRPQTALNNAIEDLAVDIAAPLVTQQKRILELMNGYVTRLEAAEKAEAKRREDALKAQVAEQQRKITEAQEARVKAEEEARKAVDEASHIRLSMEAKRSQEAAEAAQLAQEMALEAAKIGLQAVPKAKVPGGRVDHIYEFELTDVEAVVRAGSWRLLRWELDKLNCKDAVKAQLEINPDAEPSLPGIRITRKTSVSVRASA